MKRTLIIVLVIYLVCAVSEIQSAQPKGQNVNQSDSIGIKQSAPSKRAHKQKVQEKKAKIDKIKLHKSDQGQDDRTLLIKKKDSLRDNDKSSEAPKAKWTMLSKSDMEHLRPLENVISRALVLLAKKQYDEVYKILAAPKVITTGETLGKTETRIVEIKEKSQQFVESLTKDLDALAPMKFELNNPPEDAEEVVLFISTGNSYYRIGQQWYLSSWQ